MTTAGRKGGPTPDAGGAISVRVAEPDDAPAIALLHVRAWQAGYRGLMDQTYLDGLDVAERTRSWQRSLGEPRERPRPLVGTVDDRVAGFITFGPARDTESGTDGELYALNVHPDHWRAGVGSALLFAAHDGLADLGHHEATLWVVTGNVRARSF